ncbi:ATP-binding protein [Reichenbachiella ulvae]|uniref:histidine kinase n=1 Tax=Reichenbachiella ulvae TaxID=2980104 RepID=A0ABT3CNU5_9BACT|nr:ATP-binding protein [Reichenbachiella ulvae]MCV9385125.1 ATP-binding protein [Reichenbachiella ulvae]
MKRFSLFVFLGMTLPFFAFPNSWEDTQLKKKGELELYWDTSVPFIWQDTNGEMQGLEYEVLLEFQQFLLNRKGIDLELNWIKAENFAGILAEIKNSPSANHLGVSAFSITDERKELYKFSSSYLMDVTVLVSSEGSPIVHGYDEIYKMLNTMEAVTIKGTSYETLLIDLQDRLSVDFDIRYIGSDENLLKEISSEEGLFGFIDLPIYMMDVKRGGKLSRQNFFTVKGQGYAYLLPKDSDWDEPFAEFLADSAVQEKVAAIASKYIGSELYEFIDYLYGYDQLGTLILTKEKEMQLALVQNANLQLEKEKGYKRILILGIAIALLFLMVIGVLFFNNIRKTRMMGNQKKQIEAQQENIQQKNEQLMNRNAQLLALNEDKNQLVSILAHDLRAPLNHIISVSSMLEGNELSEEDRKFMGIIDDSARTMSQMITKILDVNALEQNKSAVLREKVGVRHIIVDVVNRYRQAASKKMIHLDIHYPSVDAIMQTDHLLLFLVLENLLSNAIKFSPSKSTIVIKAEEEERTVLFSIKDEGPGFTEEDMKDVFGRFKKLSAKPTAGESSTGLGLSIVKKYVSDLGGQVWLESESGKGSTFFVSLPL